MDKAIAMHFSTALLWFQPFVVLRSSRRELDTLLSLPTSAKIKQTVNTDASLSAELAMLLFGMLSQKDSPACYVACDPQVAFS